MITTPSMGLKRWDQPNDIFSYTELSDNFNLLDLHDHTAGKGVQIPTNGLANLSVTNPKLAAGAVDSSKLAAGAVNNAALGTGAVTTGKIADDGVTSRNLSLTYDNQINPTGLELALTTAQQTILTKTFTVPTGTTAAALVTWHVGVFIAANGQTTMQSYFRLFLDGVQQEFATVGMVTGAAANISLYDDNWDGARIFNNLAAGSHTVHITGMKANATELASVRGDGGNGSRRLEVILLG
jgi:hypothetical protein